MRRLNRDWRKARQFCREARTRVKSRPRTLDKLREAVQIGAEAWPKFLNKLKAPVHRRIPLPASPPRDLLTLRDAHRLQSYQLWFERLRVHGKTHVPPLDLLHAELVRGIRRRSAYPLFEFPAEGHPTVSVIIPVHDGCEATYHCLCSLLFVYNDTQFEVIVVDNDSSDETKELGNFVRGIQIVRCPFTEEFARVVDYGVARARGEFLLVLNNYSELSNRWLDELVFVFRNFEGVVVAGSKEVRPSDETAGDTVCDHLRKVDCVPRAAWMISRAIWDEARTTGSGRVPDLSELAANARSRNRFAVLVPTSVVYLLDSGPAETAGAHDGRIHQGAKSPRRNALRQHGRGNAGRDRVALRVLFIEQETPRVDRDAGSYAAFQEMRIFQALGATVTFLPRNLAWMGRHTIALQRIGVECLFAPYVTDFGRCLLRHASDYDLVYVVRHRIAEQVIPLVRNAAPDTKVVFNLADLHFLREQREAGLSGEYSEIRAAKTRRKELAAVTASDLTFSYSDAELAVLRKDVTPETRIARMPWVVECQPRTVSFTDTKDILFLGWFGHPPNCAAVSFFVRQVMPLLQERLPTAVFNVVGSDAQASISDLASDRIHIIGHVPELGEWLGTARVFVAPLLAGAGLKGKVLDALSHGVPSVLSPVAAEGTGLSHGIDCLIAHDAKEWAECVFSLYTDEDLWTRLADGALRAAQSRFSFAAAVSALEGELAGLGLTCHRDWGIPYLHTRPDRYAVEFEQGRPPRGGG